MAGELMGGIPGAARTQRPFRSTGRQSNFARTPRRAIFKESMQG